MTTLMGRDRRIFEWMLIIVTLGMTCLLYRIGGYKIVALNLYYLPIVLSGYYLGKNHAGILALLSALVVTIVITADATGFAAYDSPIMIGLALTIWAAVLGLTAILVGTLCDERAKTVAELEVAYVGVIEVFSKYLQSANPEVKATSVRVAELSHRVGQQMGLSRKQIDDVRIGALLYDLGNVEITTTLIRRAVSTLGNKPVTDKNTFMGTDLVQSLGSVLHSALPLLLNQDEAARELLRRQDDREPLNVPIGAMIIRAVRAFDDLTSGGLPEDRISASAAIREMRQDTLAGFNAGVLSAIEQVTRIGPRHPDPVPALV